MTSLRAPKDARCKTHPLCVNPGVPFWTREKTHRLLVRWQASSPGIRADVTVVLKVRQSIEGFVKWGRKRDIAEWWSGIYIDFVCLFHNYTPKSPIYFQFNSEVCIFTMSYICQAVCLSDIIGFIIKRTCLQSRTRARQLRARFTATFIITLSMQYIFNSCSFNYKSDYSVQMRLTISTI